MALIFRGSLCALCTQSLSDPILATSGIFLPLNDPLACYCDAGMHWDCYAVWEHQPRFAKAYVRFWIENEKENPYWARVLENEHCFIVINPHSPLAQAHVRLFTTGSRIEVPLQDWEKWIWQKGPSLTHHSFEEDALNVALSAIRLAFPGLGPLLQAADWSRKDKLKDKLEEETYLGEQRSLELVAEHNQRCQELKDLLDSDGLVCPRCHQKTEKIRYFDKSPKSRSYFVCQLCARSFRAEDFVKPRRYGNKE